MVVASMLVYWIEGLLIDGNRQPKWMHKRELRSKMGSGSRRCTAVTKSGTACRSWATIYSDPPLCAAHHLNGRDETAAEARAQPLRVLLEQFEQHSTVNE
ncbi:MAG: hypothetical protein R3293_24950 [Candidatus Promineifilaceae bacterium]|nr:hypothetical protein [Candidatus Promineifilaceae bacterium]